MSINKTITNNTSPQLFIWIVRPELFPGLVMRFEGTQVVYLVFESGKLVVTGSKSEDEAQRSYRHVVGILDSVYKQD